MNVMSLIRWECIPKWMAEPNRVKVRVGRKVLGNGGQQSNFSEADCSDKPARLRCTRVKPYNRDW